MELAAIISACLICFFAGIRIAKLERYSKQYEHYADVLMRDLYEVNFQLWNLTVQTDSGALGYVYVLKSDSGHYKIGKTSDPKNRIETFGVKLPMEVKYLVLIHTNNYHRLEALLHQQYRHKRVNGEWFDLTPTDLIYLKNFPGNTLKAAA